MVLGDPKGRRDLLEGSERPHRRCSQSCFNLHVEEKKKHLRALEETSILLSSLPTVTTIFLRPKPRGSIRYLSFMSHLVCLLGHLFGK